MINNGASKKEFSAERQLKMRTKEREVQGWISRFSVDSGDEVGVALDPSGVSNAELLDAVNAMRQEIREIKESGLPVSGQAPDTAPLEPVSEEDAQDVRFEIALMVRAIARAKAEIASIKHPMAEEDRIGAASSELDAIVQSTEQATNSILESNETIEKHIHKIASSHHNDEEVMVMVDHVAEEVIKIFEACNFQDITGQRVTKVVNTIRYIEERIRAMIDIWGVQAFEDVPVPDVDDPMSDENLMNGPQLEGKAITQDEIDALFD